MQFNRYTILVPAFVVVASASTFATHFNWISSGQHLLSFNAISAHADGDGGGGGDSGGGDGGGGGDSGGGDGGGGGDSGGGGGDSGGGDSGGPTPTPTFTLSITKSEITRTDVPYTCVNPGTTVHPGDHICYRIAFSNTGTGDQTGVNVTDAPPPFTTAVWQGGGTDSHGQTSVGLWWLQNSAPASWSGFVDFNVIVADNAPDGGQICNIATIRSDQVAAFNSNQVCNPISNPPTPVRPTCVLTASRSSIVRGEHATLSWTTTHATSFSIDQGIGAVTPVASGTFDVSPQNSVTFTGTASGPGGSVNCTAPITVTVPPNVPTCTLSASPTSITHGGHSTLRWTTAHATSVSIDHGIGTVVASSTRSVSPATTTTYTLTATGSGGTATCDTTVTVTTTTPAPTCTLSASPASIVSGGTSTLSWTTTNAASVSIDQGIGSVAASSTRSVSPATTTTYTLTATGAGGTVTCNATVTVTQPTPSPTCTLTAADASVASGATTTLSWTTTNATSFSIDQGIGAVTPLASGSTTTPPITASTTFTGTATNTHGSATCAVVVTVGGGGESPTCTMSISPSTVNRNQTATLSWGGTHIASVFIDNGIGTTSDTTGQMSISQSQNGLYTYTGTFIATDHTTLSCSAQLEVTGGGGGGGCSGSCGGGGGGPSAAITLLPHPVAAPLSYLYLSQIPYTGLDLGPIGTFLSWVALIVWSLALAYLVLFGAIPFMRRRLGEFGQNVAHVLNNEPQPALAGGLAHVAPALHAPVAPAPTASPRITPALASYSAYDGFKSLAEGEKALTIEDIVKGLSRAPERAAPAAPRPPAPRNVEPIYEHVEPIESPAPIAPAPVVPTPRIASQEPVPQVPSEVPAFIEAILAGDRERTFAMLREVARSGGDPEAFFTQAACALDDAYRARLEGVPVHPEIERITHNIATSVLERLVTALTVAVDSSYSIGITGAKLALTRALATVGA